MNTHELIDELLGKTIVYSDGMGFFVVWNGSETFNVYREEREERWRRWSGVYCFMKEGITSVCRAKEYAEKWVEENYGPEEG